MAVITPIGNTVDNTSATTQTITTTAAVAAHEGIAIVLLQNNASFNISSISDGTANVYAKAHGQNTNRDAEVWYCADPVALASGSSITITYSGATPNHRVSYAFKCDGVIAVLDGNTQTGGSLVAVSCATIGSVPAGSAKFAGCTSGNTNASLTSPSAGDWVEDLKGNPNSHAQMVHHGIVASTGVQTYDPSFGGSGSGAAVISVFSISAPAGGGAKTHLFPALY